MVTLDEEEIEMLRKQAPLIWSKSDVELWIAQGYPEIMSEGPEPHELKNEDWPVRCDDPIVD